MNRIIVVVLVIALSSVALGQRTTKSEDDASLIGSQLKRGQTQEVRIHGRGLAITAVEVTPAEGISVGELKARDPLPEDGIFGPAGVKVWIVPLIIDSSATPGERTLIAVTPKGRSSGMTIRIVTHVPKIAQLEIISATPTGTEFKLLASDEEGDLGGDKVSLVASYECEGKYSAGMCTVNKVVPKGKNLEIHATAPKHGQTLVGSCKFRVILYDEARISSKTIEKVVEYK